MKQKIIILFLIAFTNFAFGQQAQKTLVKTFNLKGSKTVLLELDAPVEIKEWSNKTMRVQMSITLQNANVHMLKYLITKGRYNLNTVLGTEGLKLSVPGRKKDVVVNKNGDKLKETVAYTIFIPSDVNAKVLNELSNTVGSANLKTK